MNREELAAVAALVALIAPASPEAARDVTDLVTVALGADFDQDELGHPVATLSPWERVRIDSAEFRTWLADGFLRLAGREAPAAAIEGAVAGFWSAIVRGDVC